MIESIARVRTIGITVLAVGSVVGATVLLTGADRGASAGDVVTLEQLGASGVLPRGETLEPEVIASLAGAGLQPAAGPNTIPAVLQDAYVRAEFVLAERASTCGLKWPLLAGVGKVVSEHALGGDLDPRGTTTGPILGPRLDGRPGIAKLTDTDDGRLDGDLAWDRAAGPMQLIPPVWQRVGADSDGDGTADPHNVYDAALTAGRFLCEGGADLRTVEGQAQAAFRYQRTESFVRATMAWMRTYGGATGEPVPPVAPPGVLPVLPEPETVTLSAAPPPARLPQGPVLAPPASLGSATSRSGHRPPIRVTPAPPGTPAPQGTAAPPGTAAPQGTAAPWGTTPPLGTTPAETTEPEDPPVTTPAETTERHPPPRNRQQRLARTSNSATPGLQG